MKTIVKNEFSRVLIVDRVPRKGSHEHIKAEVAECAALARRFDVPVIHALSARLLAVPLRGGLKVTGVVEADLEQISVISLEPFRHSVAYPVSCYYLPRKDLDGNGTQEAEPINDGLVDLGELAAETFGSELEPYPRKEGERFTTPESQSL